MFRFLAAALIAGVMTFPAVKAGTAPLCTFHLSPGTPAMQAVWIILAKTRFTAEIIQSSVKHGVQTVSVPFEIAADYIPDLLRGSDQRLERLSSAQAPESAEFADIVPRVPKTVRSPRHSGRNGSSST